MVDRDPKPTLLEAHGVRLEQTHMGLAVWGIPCDEGGPARLDVFRGFDDIFLKMQSYTEETFFTGSMRFRSFSGGGGIWQIAESFMRMGTAFEESQGQKVPRRLYHAPREKWEIPGYWPVETSKGAKFNEPLVTARNIPGDQDDPHFLDIQVLANRDVKITMRNPRLGEMGVHDGVAYLGEESMVFKYIKNGGLFPAVNALLAEMAEKLDKAKRRNPGPFDKAFS